jgi:hypothetical protein
MPECFELQLRTEDRNLLLCAGAVADELTPHIGRQSGVCYTAFNTTDFAVLDRYRLLLNREGKPYRYCAVSEIGERELGRSRSPDWA